jgi:hypothetical protein
VSENVTVVTAELDLRLVVAGGPSLPVAAHGSYSADDPWALTVAFHTGSGDRAHVSWMFARQLLTEGIAYPVGDGDVRIWPGMTDGHSVVTIAMSSPSGSAQFEIDRDAVALFLQETYLAVPAGSEEEVVDLDAEIAQLLGPTG